MLVVINKITLIFYFIMYSNIDFGNYVNDLPAMCKHAISQCEFMCTTSLHEFMLCSAAEGQISYTMNIHAYSGDTNLCYSHNTDTITIILSETFFNSIFIPSETHAAINQNDVLYFKVAIYTIMVKGNQNKDLDKKLNYAAFLLLK